MTGERRGGGGGGGGEGRGGGRTGKVEDMEGEEYGEEERRVERKEVCVLEEKMKGV